MRPSLLSLFLPPDEGYVIQLPDTTLFYHEPGRVSVSEPGISLCREDSCNRHYTPTPLSHGLCERCRRKDETIPKLAREITLPSGEHDEREGSERVVRFTRRAKG